MRQVRNRTRAALAAAVVLALAGCSNSAPGIPADAEQVSGSITVFAAASLETTFTRLAERFERDHPGSSVEFSFAGSSDLAAQIVAGAPADVLATADERTMSIVTDAALVRDAPQGFASNRLQIAVPPDNPAAVSSLADLARDDVVSVVCAPQVPCGAAAQKVQSAAGVTITPASEELSVTDVLGKVSSGEADAGLVYVTDVLAAEGRVLGIEFPESASAVNTCMIAGITGSSADPVADAFIDLVTGATGRAALKAAGFGDPE